MTTVIRINLLYSQTALIIARPSVTLQNASKQHIHSKCHILSLKSNLAIEMSQNNTLTHGKLYVSNSTKEHADNSGNLAEL